MKVSEGCPAELIYLYSDKVEEYSELCQEGVIKEGKIILEFEKLEGLAEKGYQCVCVVGEEADSELPGLCQKIWEGVKFVLSSL